MRIASVQIAASADKKLNLKRALDYIKKAKNAGADLILFPEMYMYLYSKTSGLTPADIAEPLDGQFVSTLMHAARENGIYVVCGIFESVPNQNERAYNSVVFISKTGELLSSYRKTHLCDAWGVRESDQFVPGTAPFQIIETELGKFGLVICYELRFPELSRLQAINDVDILLTPAAWYSGTLKEEHWEILIKARAIENTIFVCGSNQSSELFCGRSMIVDPMGVVLSSTGEEEAMIFADIDLNRKNRVREKAPSISNRVPSLYNMF